jgi:integrase/recombinase XerD
MTARWPDPDLTTIGRYLASLDLRSMKSQTCYRQVLHGFQDVVEHHNKLDQDVLIAWLRVSTKCWAATTRLHRTRIIDRFLDHLLKVGALDRNPIAALREACNIKQCIPIWRAFASRDPEQALGELRQPKPFSSVLGEMMAEHIALMRNRGIQIHLTV